MKVFDYASWGDNALSFTLGFWLFFLLGSIFSSQSTISSVSTVVPQNYLMATLSSKLPIFVELVLNNFIIPIAEEMFWMIGLPFALFSVMDNLGKWEKIEFFKNRVFQIIVVILVCSISFAYFHIGKLLLGFIISSIIFRTILIGLVYGDMKFDIIKGVNLVAGFGVGSHMANNILDRGVANTWTVISQNSIVVTIIIVGFLGLIFITAINRILEFFFGDRKDLQDKIRV